MVMLFCVLVLLLGKKFYFLAVLCWIIITETTKNQNKYYSIPAGPPIKNMLYGAIISQRKLVTGNFQDFGSNPPEVFLGKDVLKIWIMSKCHFNKFVLQFNWNHTLAWMFSSKFAAYFQSTFVIRTLTEGCFCELLLPSFALFKE